MECPKMYSNRATESWMFWEVMIKNKMEVDITAKAIKGKQSNK